MNSAEESGASFALDKEGRCGYSFRVILAERLESSAQEFSF
jgi:hypothetical protein